MASQPDAGAVADGQPVTRLAGPGADVRIGTEVFRLCSGDQQLPVPNDGPSMHDLVIADLDGYPARSDPERNAIRDLLSERKRTGLERYGSLLQAHNGRDARRDLLEELADAAVYARQVQEESGHRPAPCGTCRAYEHILSALFWAQKIPEAGHA